MDESGQFLDREDSEYQASFCGYFPAENPLYSCIVVIYKPKKFIYGAKFQVQCSLRLQIRFMHQIYSFTMR